MKESMYLDLNTLDAIPRVEEIFSDLYIYKRLGAFVKFLENT
jgi:hypothetical protein